MRSNFETSYQKRRYKEGLKDPGPYAEIALEQEYRNDIAIWCELTFWAVKLLDIVENFNK